jgi:hypothetical protein
MNQVEIQDGKNRPKNKGGFNEIIDNTHVEGDTTVKEPMQVLAGIQFDT